MTVLDGVMVYTAPKNKRLQVNILQKTVTSFSLKTRNVRICLNNSCIALLHRHRRYDWRQLQLAGSGRLRVWASCLTSFPGAVRRWRHGCGCPLTGPNCWFRATRRVIADWWLPNLRVIAFSELSVTKIPVATNYTSKPSRDVINNELNHVIFCFYCVSVYCLSLHSIVKI